MYRLKVQHILYLIAVVFGVIGFFEFSELYAYIIL